MFYRNDGAVVPAPTWFLILIAVHSCCAFLLQLRPSPWLAWAPVGVLLATVIFYLLHPCHAPEVRAIAGIYLVVVIGGLAISGMICPFFAARLSRCGRISSRVLMKHCNFFRVVQATQLTFAKLALESCRGQRRLAKPTDLEKDKDGQKFAFAPKPAYVA